MQFHLTYSETVSMMFLLVTLMALYGIYSQLRKIVEILKRKEGSPTASSKRSDGP